MRRQSPVLNSLNQFYDRFVALILMLTSTFYTFLLSLVLSAFRCYPQEDGKYIFLPSPHLDCDF
jgi:hypothetical protein